MYQIRSEEVWIKKENKRIFGILYKPDNGKSQYPLVILSHGFGVCHSCNTDYAKEFARNGFACYNFDFCGGSPESKSDGDMKDMSVLTEAEDLCAVVDNMKARKDIDPAYIFLLGESQGGFVSAYAAAKRGREMKGLILFYPAFILQDDAKARLLEDGSFPVSSLIMGMRVGKKYNEDAASFDIYDMIGEFKGDVLMIHGTNDAIVPLSYSKRAEKIYNSAKLIELKGQRHGFTGNGRKKAVDLTVEFLSSHCEK